MTNESALETELRKRCVNLFLGLAKPGSSNRQSYESGFYDFNPEMRQKFSIDGTLDLARIYESIGMDDQLDVLLKRCLQLNFTELELRDIIEFRYTACYQDWPNRAAAQSIVDSNYPEWCQFFGIQPRAGFKLK